MQTLNWSATEESGSEVGNDAVWAMRLRDWPQIETRAAGVRSRTDDTSLGIRTPEFSSEFSSISRESSI